MTVISSGPKIEFYHTNQNGTPQLYYIFSPVYDPKYPSGLGLTQYSFQLTKNQFTSQWSCTIKENSINNDDFFIDKVKNLDVIKIYENDNNIADYIGLVTTVSFNASASGPSKVLNISGKGIEYLFEFASINLDSTAMAFVKNTRALETVNAFLKIATMNNNSIEDALKSIYSKFSLYAKTCYSTLANILVFNMIDYWFGSDFIDAQTNMNFKYDITNNMFVNTIVTYPGYIRTLLPDQVYEFYGCVINGKPKIRVREMPYSGTDWLKLANKGKSFDPNFLTDYTLTHSVEEVYTVFMSYLEGSTQSPDYYQKVNASENGYDTLEKDEEKIKLYGYKPLTINFVGYNPETAENNDANSKLQQELAKLNKKAHEWYGHLDEFYDATFSVIHNTSNNTRTGDVVSFNKGQFYVTGEDHQWSYNSFLKIVYHCERGAIYNTTTGNFEKALNGINIRFGEFNK